MAIIIGNWNDSLPAAPANSENVRFQVNRAVSPPNISANVRNADIAGSYAGLILYDGSDHAYRYLGSDGDFHNISDIIPEGGSAGQILSKVSGDNYDTQWSNAPESTPNYPITRSIVTTSRAIDTVYQNTTGYAILVFVRVYNAGGSFTATAYCDSSSPPSSAVGAIYQSSGGFSASLMLVVPNNYYYKIAQTTGTVTLLNWNEYTLTNVQSTDSGSLTGSRTWTTVYQNTGSDPIMVQCIITAGSTYVATASSDLGSSPTDIVWRQRATAAGVMPVYFLVPPGHYYKLTYDVSMTITEWREYTLEGLTVYKSPDLGAQRSFTDYQTIRNNYRGRFVSAVFNPAGTGTAQMRTYSGDIASGDQTLYGLAESGTNYRMGLGLFVRDEWYRAFIDSGGSYTSLWEYEFDIT